MRKDASHRSEQVSQLLFGEAAEILEEGKEFIHIKALYDGYEGWCAKSQLADIEDKAAFNAVTYIDNTRSTALLNNTPVPLAIATPVFQQVSFGNYTIAFEESVLQQTQQALPATEQIKQLAYQYLNTPYLWGGKSNFGIDCSGFTQQVFKMAGRHLLRDAYQQATQGEVVGFLQEVQCGDLAYFDNEDGRITHVGILLDSQTIIHSSGYVRVDKIDTQGIIHSVTGRRTHKLRIIKRVA
jgi:cell wall-associated NlpC family hydrolase